MARPRRHMVRRCAAAVPKERKLNPLAAIAGCGAYLRGLFRTFPEMMKYCRMPIYKDGLIALLSIGGVLRPGARGISSRACSTALASIFGTIGGLFLAGPLDRIFGPRQRSCSSWACSALAS